MRYIDNAIVKLYRLNVFSDVLTRKDILNIDSRHQGLDGKLLFEEGSAPMATIRGESPAGLASMIFTLG